MCEPVYLWKPGLIIKLRNTELAWINIYENQIYLKILFGKYIFTFYICLLVNNGVSLTSINIICVFLFFISIKLWK